MYGWSSANIRHLYIQAYADFARRFSYKRGFIVTANRVRSEGFGSYIGPLVHSELLLREGEVIASSLSSFLCGASLPESQSRIDTDENERQNFHDKSFIVAGCILFALGIVFLYKVWWKLSFDFSSNMNVAAYVALVIVCFVVMWFGMGLLGIGFHLFSLASFHRTTLAL